MCDTAMEKIWLATKYYLDDKLVGCSAATERLFTRLIAWVGDNETGGILPLYPHIMVVLPRATAQLRDLVDRGVLVPRYANSVQNLQQHPCRTCNNIRAELVAGNCTQCATESARGELIGYRLAGWGNWNAQADELAERKRSDRERKRRERQRKAEQSRDTSRDVTALDEDEDKDRDKDPYSRKDDDSRNVGARQPSSSFADGVPIPDEPPPTEITGTTPPRSDPGAAARTVVRQELGSSGYPRKTTDRLAAQVAKLASQGVADDVTREALREWERRSGARPEWLETIAGDVVQNRRARAAPAGVTKPSKLRGIAELAAAERATETARTQQEIAR
ncbi:hypothetical protein KNT98_gp73 [Gordonia phage Frokostdame]|uniref:Helix-turn-helix DNA binding domain protein n=1 Tax=Gordonia phage Frokostdame TaxID=2250320 RepID=A0A345L363_9CAUD|nr:hypothetical protein KNT98_gp73 [Gordonia phage Frokostdame]AXH49715.1 hypothetical protein SEA_FROKOSTDAME_73 [Gordonia phage Frokostdame]